MRILAIDPGEKVGWARCELSSDGTYRSGSLRHGITDLKSMAVRMAKVYGDYDVVIMESFRLSAAHAKELVGSTMPTVQFVGMIRLLSWQNPRVELVEQSPSTKRTGRKVMKQVDPTWVEIVSQPGAHDDTHDYDAIIHLAYWLWRQV